jgi:hypothetical protein
VPVTKAYVVSSTFLKWIEVIGERSSVVGVNGLYTASPCLNQRIKNKQTEDFSAAKYNTSGFFLVRTDSSAIATICLCLTNFRIVHRTPLLRLLALCCLPRFPPNDIILFAHHERPLTFFSQLDVTFTDPYNPNSGPNSVIVSSDYELTWQANAE